jgi:hypothetical protein
MKFICSLVLVFVCIVYCFATDNAVQHLKLKYSSFNYSNNFQNTSGFNYSFYQQKSNLEVKFNGEFFDSNSGDRNQLILGIDIDGRVIDMFTFVSYASNSALYEKYSRLGFGIAWTPSQLKTIYKFPYKHKFSLAIINETKMDMYLSARYKFDLEINKVKIKLTYFSLIHGYTFRTNIYYKLGSNVNLLFSSYEEKLHTKKYQESSLGFEFELMAQSQN